MFAGNGLGGFRKGLSVFQKIGDDQNTIVFTLQLFVHCSSVIGVYFALLIFVASQFLNFAVNGLGGLGELECAFKVWRPPKIQVFVALQCSVALFSVFLFCIPASLS